LLATELCYERVFVFEFLIEQTIQEIEENLICKICISIYVLNIVSVAGLRA